MLRFFKALVLTGAVLAVTPALAANEFCNKELAPFFTKKQALEAQLVAINKTAKQPGAREKFCGTMVPYLANLRGLVGYFEKNKDFCEIPEEQVSLARKALAQNITLRKKICSGPPPQAQSAPQGGGERLPPPPVKLQLQ